MTPSSIKKVFGIISYFPNNDTAYHIETRRERTRRCSELLFRLEELWPDIDIMFITQNWQDYEPPKIKNTIIRFDYSQKLGILGARRTLRQKFLESEYDYLIMLDDDGRILEANPEQYIEEIDKHPDGVGFIRHHSCPLMLLAISKNIYSQIDMPNIDPENGEGFEDDIFVSNCISNFPDSWFDFPENCIKEFSLKYKGPGACPSTWAKEKEYNWKYMERITSSITNSKKVENKSEDTKKEIDIVIPYVDSSDRKWMTDYTRTLGIYSATPVRFRSWGTLKYVLRGIEKYMPFVRDVILVVARQSQLPIWLNTQNVRVVYHADFIPKEFLPTFNSCTIESFLYNIKGLSDRFIYFNDDIFPLNPLSIDNFFTGNIPHIRFNKYDSYDKTNMYRKQSRNALDTIADVLKTARYPVDKLILPEHTANPMLKSTLDFVGKECKSALTSSISRLRNYKNINQYIYSYYHYFTDTYKDEIFNYLYMEVKNNINSIKYVILESNIQLICLNDSDTIKNYSEIRLSIHEIFDKKFPYKSKYED